jgi:nucleotide-binding universal stress UspA family protein
MPHTPFIRSVFHPSDFSEASRNAFMHAMAIVLYYHGGLTVLHVAASGEPKRAWLDSPLVRETLERWRLLEPDSERAAVYSKLSMQISKIIIRSDTLLEPILSGLEKNPSDLLVLATEGRQGLPRWLKPSVAEGVSRRVKVMTLFVPATTRGFVDPDDGYISLKRILVPVDHHPDPAQAILSAAQAAVMSHEENVQILLLRVDDANVWPEMDMPELETCTWKRLWVHGDTVEQIVSAAQDYSVDLIVMGTEGAKGVLGALRGSVTEQVLRQAPCPVLAVPDRK